MLMKHNTVALKHIRHLLPVWCAANTQTQFRTVSDKTASEAICMYNKTLDFCKLQSASCDEKRAIFQKFKKSQRHEPPTIHDDVTTMCALVAAESSKCTPPPRRPFRGGGSDVAKRDN